MLRAFPKDSTSTWHNQDSNPGPPDPEAKCLPLDHNATLYQNIFVLRHIPTIYHIISSVVDNLKPRNSSGVFLPALNFIISLIKR